MSSTSSEAERRDWCSRWRPSLSLPAGGDRRPRNWRNIQQSQSHWDNWIFGLEPSPLRATVKCSHGSKRKPSNMSRNVWCTKLLPPPCHHRSTDDERISTFPLPSSPSALCSILSLSQKNPDGNMVKTQKKNFDIRIHTHFISPSLWSQLSRGRNALKIVLNFRVLFFKVSILVRWFNYGKFLFVYKCLLFQF